MTASYHGPQSCGQHGDTAPPEFLALAFCHACVLQLPAGSLLEFCRSRLPLVQLGARLTTEIVLRTLVCPSADDGN